MPRQRFSAPASVTLDADGAGHIEISARGNQVWRIERLSLRVLPVGPATEHGSIPQADVFMNGTGEGHFIEGTYTGHRNMSDTPHELQPGDRLIIVWTGGDPGARATAIARGWQQPVGEAD